MEILSYISREWTNPDVTDYVDVINPAKGSFFGDMHGQGIEAVQFFMQKKVVVERWSREWMRKF